MGVEGGWRLPGGVQVKPLGGGIENAREGGGAHDCSWLVGAPRRALPPGNKFGCCRRTDVEGALTVSAGAAAFWGTKDWTCFSTILVSAVEGSGSLGGSKFSNIFCPGPNDFEIGNGDKNKYKLETGTWPKLWWWWILDNLFLSSENK